MGHISLANLPPTLLLTKGLDAAQFASVRKRLSSYSAPVVSRSPLASVFLCDTEQSRRAVLELRGVGLWTEAHTSPPTTTTTNHPAKIKTKTTGDLVGKVVWVVKLDWFTLHVEKGEDADWRRYVVYEGRVVATPEEHKLRAEKLRRTDVGVGKTVDDLKKMVLTSPGKHGRSPSPLSEAEKRLRRKEILERAEEDRETAPQTETREARDHRGTWRGRKDAHPKKVVEKPPMLLKQTTEEFEEEHQAELDAPDAPHWVKKTLLYACQRSTPMHPPKENEAFVEQLRKIRLNRILISDEIGNRAYSTAIASILAYPYPITTASQIQSLPGCEKKIASLWYEFHHSPDHRLSDVKEIEESEYYRTLELFWNIWGVGGKTARHFWMKGWRDLDDVVEQGWESLTRVQQIGLKYYDEFLIKIPRDEVESMRDIILHHARILLPGAEACVVGGYRRGKQESGDVDILISHPSVSKSRDVEDLLVPLVDELERIGLVTHVLVIHSPSNHVSSADGEIFPKNSHHNFDGIPKALLVWQSPPSSSGGKNANPHRRLDILFPPPRAMGSTVLSWSGATTFERDIRRFVKHEYEWKFSSEGLTDRRTGKRVPIEGEADSRVVGLLPGQKEEELSMEIGDNGEWVGWKIEEKKVFELINLEYREPWERWTN